MTLFTFPLLPLQGVQKTFMRFLVLCFVTVFVCVVLAPQAHAANNKRKAKNTAAQTYKAGKHAKAYGKAKFRVVSGSKFKNKSKRGAKFQRVKYFVPAVPSVGVMSGLHNTPDPLSLKSSVAMVVDANTSQVLFEKNAYTALPIASITKLMTALVVVDSQQDLNERLIISQEDVNLEQRVRSRLSLGSEMSRRDALQLALMASENRAANMLTRYYPGGKPAFVDAMNRKAAQLGMTSSSFVEGTGLLSANVASASDLVRLVKAAQKYPLIRELSTQTGHEMINSQGRAVGFHSTNRLIGNPNWDISLQKTGFINAAGQCLVMATHVDGRAVIMVFLDSAGKLSRLGDAQRVRDWLSGASASASASVSATAAPEVALNHNKYNKVISGKTLFADRSNPDSISWSAKSP